MLESRIFELHKTVKMCEMVDTGDGVRPVLTLLGNEFNQGDESDVRRGDHGMVQEGPTKPAAILITEDDGASCTQAHPANRSQPLTERVVAKQRTDGRTSRGTAKS